MWHRDIKWANGTLKNDADTLVQGRVATNLRFFKNITSMKCTKTRYAYIEKLLEILCMFEK